MDRWSTHRIEINIATQESSEHERKKDEASQCGKKKSEMRKQSGRLIKWLKFWTCPFVGILYKVRNQNIEI